MIRLEKRGEKKAIDLTKTRADSVGQKIQITLRWRAAVDLDLHAFAITKKGCFEHIYFSNKGSAKELPFITLDKDAGVGNTAGDNEENLVVHKLDEYSKIVFGFSSMTRSPVLERPTMYSLPIALTRSS